MKLKTISFLMAFMACACAAQAINIDTVPIGDPGNMADNTTSYGAVGYAYNIGKYEVKAGEYTAFLNAVGGVDTYALYNTNMSNTSYGSGITRSGGGTVENPYIYSVATDFFNRPVNYVSWGDAARFCNWLANGQPNGAQGLSTTENGSYYLNGKTSDADLMTIRRKANTTWVIPTEDEWYKAAYYKGSGTNAGYLLYPTGSDTIPGCDMADASGNNANYYGSGFPIDSGKYTTIAGEFQNSDSPYGTFDQGGNVYEWNEVIISNYRGLRGGCFSGSSDGLASSSRGANYPTIEDSTIGFRVANVPEPSSLVMLACGVVAGLIGLKCGK